MSRSDLNDEHVNGSHGLSHGPDPESWAWFLGGPKGSTMPKNEKRSQKHAAKREFSRPARACGMSSATGANVFLIERLCFSGPIIRDLWTVDQSWLLCYDGLGK